MSKSIRWTGTSHAFALLRRNAAFSCLLAGGGILRLLVWLAYHPAILVLADSYFYLKGAILGSGLGSDRPFLYSLLLKPVLFVDGLAAVTAIQHVLGLAVASALYVFQRRLNVPRVLAAIGTSFVVLDAYQLNLEQQILTETLFESLMVGGLVTLLWFERAPTWVHVLGGVVLGMAAITRYIGLSLLFVVPIFLVWRRVGWIRLCATVTGCLVPVLLYATLFQGNANSPSLRNRVAVRLYGKVASFADCSPVELPSTEQQLCIGKPPSERRDFYSVWGDSPVNRMQVPAGIDKGDVVASFTRRFIFLQPLDFARAVARDFGKFFSWFSVQDLVRRPVRRWEFFESRRQAFHRSGNVGTDRRFQETRGSPPSEFGLDERFRLDRSLAGWLRDYQRFFYARGPMLGFLALLGLLGALLGRELQDTRPGARLSCLLLTVSGLALYLFPALFATFHFRYVISALPLLGPAGAMGSSLLLFRLRGRDRAGSSGEHEEAGKGK